MAESVAKPPVKAEKAIKLLVRAGSVASVRDEVDPRGGTTGTGFLVGSSAVPIS